MTNASAQMLNKFFNLGNKATKGDPVRKAQFDYYLYWIVFLAFCSLAFTYYWNFFAKDAPITTLFWGLVITIFCWFNYFALGAFRSSYESMKQLHKIRGDIKTEEKEEEFIEDSVEDMLGSFKESIQ